jgi:hypothetical protein
MTNPKKTKSMGMASGLGKGKVNDFYRTLSAIRAPHHHLLAFGYFQKFDFQLTPSFNNFTDASKYW